MSVLNSILKMIMADPAAVAELQAMAAAPTVTRKPAKGKGKRTLTDEQKAKMAAGRKAASAARAAATGKPAPAPVVEAAKPAKVAKPAEAWTVKDHVTQKGIKGRIVTVGPFSCWLPDGDADKRQAAADAINKVFRTEQVNALWAAVTR